MTGFKQNIGKLRIEHIWCLTVIAGVFAFVNTHPIRPNDFWWQLTVGRVILNTHQIPFTDIYSYTENGTIYLAYHMFWLMEVGYYWLFTTGGLALIIFTHSLIISVAYLLLLITCKHLTGSWRLSAFMTLFAIVLGISDWNVRPQAIAFLIGALFLLGIYQYRNEARVKWLAAFPIGMAIWVNSHGSFPLGFAIMGIWWLDEFRNDWKSRSIGKLLDVFKPVLVISATILVTTLAIFANPLRLGILDYIDSMANNNVIQNLVPEWAPPSLSSFNGSLFWIGFGLCVIVIFISIKRLSFFQILTFLLASALAIKTSRGIIWFGILMAPVLAVLMKDIKLTWPVISRNYDIRSGQYIWLNYSFVILIFLLSLVSLPWFKSYLPMPQLKAGLISSETPVAGTNYLIDNHLPAPVFSALSFSSYLIWAAQPTYQVFVDPRLELYPLELWKVYSDVSNGNNDWVSYLNQYHIQTLFISPTEQPGLAKVVVQSKNWEKVYQDDHSMLFVRLSVTAR